MVDVTDTKQDYDPWTDPDPDPEQAEAWFDDPENIWYSIHIPRNTPIFVVVPEGISDEEWDRRKAADIARCERRSAEEERDWSPEQKAARQAERVAAEEAFAMCDRGEIPIGSAVTWHRGGDLREWPTREALEQDQD